MQVTYPITYFPSNWNILTFFYHFSICFVYFYIICASWALSCEFTLSKGRKLRGNVVFKTTAITGLPVRPSHKMGFRSSAAKNGLPGEGRHEGLVPRYDVLTNGFIWFSLAWTLARILFVPRLRSPWKTHKALRTWRRLFALFEAIRSWESLYNLFIVGV